MRAIKVLGKWLFYSLAFLIGLAIVAILVFDLVIFLHQNEDRIKTAPPSGHFVQAGDIQMYVQEWGPKDGPAVVFLHAAGGWSEVWKETGEAIAKEGFHAIALDMPPLGYSERPDTPRYSREDQAKRVLGVLDALHIEKAVLVGHSFGGRAVAEVALEHPERVRAIVFVDAALSFGTGSTSRSTPLDIAMRFPAIRTTLAAATFSNPLFTKKLLQLFVALPESATPYWVSIYQAPIHVKGSAASIGDWLPQLLAEHDFSISSNPDAYRRIKVPTLVIWGDKDTTTPLSLGRYIADIIPHAKLVVMPGVGHLPPLEDTNTFNGDLLKFLKAQL